MTNPLYTIEQLPTTSAAAIREFDDRYIAALGAAKPTGWVDRLGALVPTIGNVNRTIGAAVSMIGAGASAIGAGVRTRATGARIGCAHGERAGEKMNRYAGMRHVAPLSGRLPALERRGARCAARLRRGRHA